MVLVIHRRATDLTTASLQSFSFVESEHQVHVLHSLSAAPFN